MNHIDHIHLTKRETEIFQLTVEEYILKNRPIGSEYLRNHFHLNISPATIRNALAALESKGLIKQPFTSSGRIPTDLGYRYYVDHLMEDSSSYADSVDEWSSALNKLSLNIEELMQATATMLAKATKLFGVVLVSEVQQGILRNIECIPLSSDRIMVVLAMDSGIIRSMVFNLEITIDNNDLLIINQILNEYLTGVSLKDIQQTAHHRLRNTIVYNHEIVQILLQHPRESFSFPTNNLIYTSSNQFLFSHSDFQQVNKMQTFLNALETQKIKRILTSENIINNKMMLIGEENKDKTFNDFSILSTKFQSEYLEGKLAIFGPKRIPYNNIKTILEHFSEIITHVC